MASSGVAPRSAATPWTAASTGRKILISGGGRCNFTNLHCTPANFLSENPHFAKSALSLYQPRHFIELVERYGIRWHEKTLGQLFCDHSARAILDMLLAECALGNVELICDECKGTRFKSAILDIRYKGLNVRGGTQGVGRATTQAVVVSNVMIIACDVFLTKIALFLGDKLF